MTGRESAEVSRRAFLAGAGALVVGSLVPAATAQAAPRGDIRAPFRTLTSRVSTVDIGARRVRTWTFGGALPGPEIRLRAGRPAAIRYRNLMPAGGTVHWHGVALNNPMDGVPDMTQPAVPTYGHFDYRFTPPDPGTYFYHSHVGLQLDRGLYGPLIVEDPHERGRYDREYVVVLDDWTDGVAGTPEQVMAKLRAGKGAMIESPDTGGHVGDWHYPYYLVNGRTPNRPDVFEARRGDRIRLRIINAGSDTTFKVAVGGHRLLVTHTDGFPVKPVMVDTALISMGERLDAIVTIGDGSFPFVAEAVGRRPGGVQQRAQSVIRTRRRAPLPKPNVVVAQLTGRLLQLRDLQATSDVFLPPRTPDREYAVHFGGAPGGFIWMINGHVSPKDQAMFPVVQGSYVRMNFVNDTPMAHPVHLHGVTYQVRVNGADGKPGAAGPRKDTVLLRPFETVRVEFEANNPGDWMIHCHNTYHGEAGMMGMWTTRNMPVPPVYVPPPPPMPPPGGGGPGGPGGPPPGGGMPPGMPGMPGM